MAWPDWVVAQYIKLLYRPLEPRLRAMPFVRIAVAPRLALVTSCGVHRRDDRPFEVSSRRGDPTFRTLALDDDRSLWTVTHGHYDDVGVRADFEICLPARAARELIAESAIAALHANAYSFAGFTRELEEFLDVHVARVAGELLAGEVTAAFLTPC
ncbi:MAG: glycine/betaine/sarcosine/D-proline family reductase selenoprotein B [Planctomycetes bacterium]|nr:glycine/betaine/sarcosine/D-proline family reductase selenoprotein B [Planctomycetota bacterium]